MSKNSFSRFVRIVTGTFGTGKEEAFSSGTSHTRLEKFAHFWVLVWKSFVRNRCPVRASALSYTTLLAMIPMLAVAMSITSIFLKSEGEEQIEAFIEKFVDRMVPSALTETNAFGEFPFFDESFWSEQTSTNDVVSAPAAINLLWTETSTNALATPIREVRIAAQKKAAGYIHRFIQNTYSGTLGVTGAVFLLATAILMLVRVEDTFNDIWGVTRGRSWLSRVVLYWAAITLVPVLLAGAMALASGPHYQETRDWLAVTPFLKLTISNLLPIVVVCLTFALFYKLVPHTKVHFRAALVGGVLAGISWHLINLVSLRFASSAVNANRIYGSIALVPIFMGGLYLIWLTVLFGAQVAYAYQNREAYLQEKLAENVNQRGREFVALRLMTCISQRFHHGLPPATVPEMSHELGIPSKLIQQVLCTLLAAHLIVEVSGTESGYSPARPLETINCHHILLAMRATQGQELITRDEPVRAELLGEFARIQAAEEEASSVVTMLALVNRTQARLEIAPATQEKEIKFTPAFAKSAELPDEAKTAPPQEIETVALTPVEEMKPVSVAEISPVTPTAESSTNDNESFPL